MLLFRATNTPIVYSCQVVYDIFCKLSYPLHDFFWVHKYILPYFLKKLKFFSSNIWYVAYDFTEKRNN